jgi:hypothetical protein
MRWQKPNLRNIHSFWGQVARGEATTDARTERVRHAMLEATPVVGPGEPHSAVFGRIRRAPDIQALWYLRSELMAAISSSQGEQMARREMAAVTKLFKGLVPESRDQKAFGARRKNPRS